MQSKNLLGKGGFRCLLIVLVTTILLLSVLVDQTLEAQSGLVVVNTLDAGDGSLRQAILAANQTPGQAVIQFAIPGGGPHSIALLSPLPPLTEAVIIDGVSQPGASCTNWPPTLMVELDGGQAGLNASGLTLTGDNIQVRGLVINRFDEHGIFVSPASNYNQVECNFLGTDATGTIALGNGESGIFMSYASHNRVGKADLGVGNLISGNQQDGVVVSGELANNNIIAGNFIGTDVTGSRALGNRQLGVFIDQAPFTTVGGIQAGAGNVIAGNGWEGIFINGPAASSNTVAGNVIGTDVTGTAALGNGFSGISISNAPGNLIGGSLPGAGNVIAANGRKGIYVFGGDAVDNVIVANHIGTDRSGALALGNASSGIYLDQAGQNTIGGREADQQNHIAYNGEYGIFVYSPDSQLQQIEIGLDETYQQSNQINHNLGGDFYRELEYVDLQST